MVANGDYEYQSVSHADYNSYLAKADEILSELAENSDKVIKNIDYLDVIHFFENKFNLLFIFFDKENSPYKPHRYKYLLKNSEFEYRDNLTVEKVSGFTIAVPNSTRVLIFVNQSFGLSRAIFTIFHELTHFYWHYLRGNNQIIFASLAESSLEGQYAEEEIPFENEANIIASVWFLPTKQLEFLIQAGYPFSEISKFTNMSHSALQNRLLNYCHHILKLPYKKSLGYAWNFRNDKDYGDKSLKTLVVEKLASDESDSDYVNLVNGGAMHKTEATVILANLTYDKLLGEYRFARLKNDQKVLLLTTVEKNRRDMQNKLLDIP
ncbi:ImmA/IrrE family metallo-endopeptidase [Lactococcus lactis subsp. lactis]|uniref:ImmA/IrrE family metallo-endopeptidase n=1 Tax=Lactococcus lactis TaxID=1358 RepID=UPI002A7FE013|nr:ImmA/IrrE family metallo-endopeptidase [Lactococcus lactis]MDY4362054.1 ImmA/IrrE family metallo-endopeptidase [Lactococcus lactis subsp. lactis]